MLQGKEIEAKMDVTRNLPERERQLDGLGQC